MNIKNVKTISAAVLACAMLAGCGKNENEAPKNEAPKEDVMAVSVNGEKLMQSAVDADVNAIFAAQGSTVPKEHLAFERKRVANQIVQSFLVEKVLAAKAKKDGYVVTDADRKAREDEFLKAISNSKSPDAPKTVDEFFKKNPLGEARARAEFESGILIDKMIKAEQAKAPKTKDHKAEAQKMIDNIISNNAAAKTSDADVLKKIQELKAQLDKTPAAEIEKKFAELAKANSACPSSKKGGDLGEFTHGQMVKEFDEMAFKLPLKKVSDPVKTKFGYHLILVTKKVPAVEAKDNQPAAPEKVQASHILLETATSPRDVPKLEDVVKFMEQQDEREFVRKFVMDQMKAADIETSEDYKMFLPEKDAPKPSEKAPAAKSKATPVEKPAGK